MRVRCPHCGEWSIIKSSKQMSTMVKEIKCACNNFYCGHTFIATIEIVRTISPSGCPDPSVLTYLKQSNMAKKIHGEKKEPSSVMQRVI